MRRAAVLAVMVGGVVAVPVLPDRSVVEPWLPPSAVPPVTKLVRYGGLRLPVPATWPVYRLDHEPTRCVRFDRHAVYLGRPGADQDCPARLTGRTEALLVEPLKPEPGSVTAALGRHLRAVRTPPQSPSLAGYVVPWTVARQARVRLPDAGVAVTATYGADREVVQRVLRGSSRIPAWSGWGLPATPDSPAPPDIALRGGVPGEPDAIVPGERPGAPAGISDMTAPETERVSRSPGEDIPQNVRENVPEDIAGAPEGGGGVGRRRPWASGRAFDTCTAPSLHAMSAWRRAYPIANIYIGGAARGCEQPNLTRWWVRSVRRMDYRLIPTYVGLQAPCNKRYQGGFTIEQPTLEGRLSADDAVRNARALGIRRRAPIYYDMEAYNSRKTRCREAVLEFLHEWSRRLRQHGYRPGVYSSVGSGIRDLGLAEGIVKPRAIWFAHWDGKARTYGSRYIPDHWWYPHRRIKQYRGGHKEKHGGVTINVDSNIVDGLVY